MSHASGTVKFNDGLVLHYEYDGTSDVCIPALHHTHEEMDNNWRNQPKRTCTCENDEPVLIYTNYGGGFEWEGMACRHCMCITRNLIPIYFQSSSDCGWGFDY